MVASTQRQSSWGSLFTSKFGETASIKALFENLENDDLKSIILEATQIAPQAIKDFKDFAQEIREKYEVHLASSTNTNTFKP